MRDVMRSIEVAKATVDLGKLSAANVRRPPQKYVPPGQKKKVDSPFKGLVDDE